MKQTKMIPILLVCCVLLMGVSVYSIVSTLMTGNVTLPDYKNITIEDPAASSAGLSEEDIQELTRTALWQEVVEKTKVNEYPEEQLNALIKEYTAELEAQAKAYDMTLDDYATLALGMEDPAMLDEEIDEIAHTNLKEEMILEEIAKREDIEVTDELYNQYIDRYVKEYEVTEEELIESYGGEEEFRHHILVSEVFDVIQENATLT